MSLEENAQAALETALVALDTEVSTPRNIKGFARMPPNGLTLYVKYRDVGPNAYEFDFPLGMAPKNIKGTILHSILSTDLEAETRFIIILYVTESDDPGDVGKVISIYPTRDRVSLYPFKHFDDLVEKKMKKDSIKKLKGYADIHQQLAFSSYEDGMAGRETIKAKARFEGKDPVFPYTEYDHDDYQGEIHDNVMAKSAHSQDDSGYKHISDDMLGGRRRRRKTRKTTRKTKRKTHRRKRRKTKSIRRRKK